MSTNKLIFNQGSKIILSTNTFINVPVILKYEDINLIEVIRDTTIKYTMKIPIFHSDGTHLAYAKGNRIFKTEEGKKAGIIINEYHRHWVCTLEGKTIFEIKQQAPDSFKTTAELFTNDGRFVKCSESPSPELFDIKGDALKIGGITMSGCTFVDMNFGVWIRKDGVVLIAG